MYDCSTIEENQIIDRYLMNTLSEDEHAQFTDHFMDCETCLEALELSEAFQRDLRHVASEGAARVVQIGMMAWLMKNWAVSAFGVALIVLLAFSPVLMNRGVGAIPTIELAAATRSDDANTAKIAFDENQQQLRVSYSLILPKSLDGKAPFAAVIQDAIGNDLVRIPGQSEANLAYFQLERDMLAAGEYQLMILVDRDGSGLRLEHQQTIEISNQ